MGIPAFPQRQLRTLIAEPPHTQNAGHRRPIHFLPSLANLFVKELVKPQTPPKGQGHVNLPEITNPLHPHAGQIHLCPQGRSRGRSEQIALPRLPGMPIQQTRHFLPAHTLIFVQSGKFAQRRDNPLPWAAGCSHRLHQSPVFVGLPVLSSAIAP
ncbi:MAG: hypothetical protein BWY80_01488 [Firmicutes bacterium ADurb.Bin456]|nr:MAG: hypothetical protein BWY80_01488 [Firmicutes bacterium ADurb.Bin456]